MLHKGLSLMGSRMAENRMDLLSINFHRKLGIKILFLSGKEPSALVAS